MAHHNAEELRDICGLLNLEHLGEKKSLIERIAKYLYKPTDLGESKTMPRRLSTQKRSKNTSSSATKGKKSKDTKKGSDATGEAEEEEESGDEEVIAELEEKSTME